MPRVTFILLLLISALPLASMQAQQKGNKPERRGVGRAAVTQDHVYEIGMKGVAIPPPAGFAEAFTQSEVLANILKATESPSNEVLTAHLPVAVLDKLKRGEQPAFDFYTKVSVLKVAKDRDMSEAAFAGLVAHIETTISQVLDINGPTMKAAVEKLRGGLNSVTGEGVQLDLEQPQNLGSFEKTKDVYSLMLLITLKGAAGKIPLLGTVSFIRVNNRLLYVYTYKKFTSEKDIEVLRDFARAWTKQILAANSRAHLR